MSREISERETELPDEVIGKLLKIASEDKSIVSLGPGEPDFPLPKPLVQEIRRLAPMCNHYSPPAGRIALKEALIKKLKRDNNIKALPENIIVTSGSQESLALATACTMDVSEHVIVPNPSYMGFVPTFELFDAVPRFVEIKQDNGFEIDPDEVKKQIDPKKTNALMLNTPGNPTGNVLSKKILEELADLAVEYNFYIFSDEAYEKIVYDGAKHISPASLNGMEDYVLTFQSFSKTYSMCGFRLGYCVGPSKVISAMVKSHLYTTICAPTISQLLGIKALSLPAKYTNDMVKEYDRRRKLIVKRLNDLNMHTLMPKGAFYAFANIKEYSNNSRFFADHVLKKAKVAVVPGSDFGQFGEGYVRCSYATDYKKIEEAMNRLEKFLSNR